MKPAASYGAGRDAYDFLHTAPFSAPFSLTPVPVLLVIGLHVTQGHPLVVVTGTFSIGSSNRYGSAEAQLNCRSKRRAANGAKKVSGFIAAVWGREFTLISKALNLSASFSLTPLPVCVTLTHNRLSRFNDR
jgi:hypothetical protein